MHGRFRTSLVLAMCLLVSVLASIRPSANRAAADTRPNILVIVTDDQAWSTFNRDLMPQTFAQLVDEGMTFNRFYDNSSECCPSRAEILTGLYEHHTGVDGNLVSLTRPTIVQALHDQGYRTMLSGKYLNSWPCIPRPEFDQWVCHEGDNAPYVDPILNVNGVNTQFTGYTGQIESNFASDFIQQTPQTQPFFVYYAPKAPHLPADDPRYDSMTVDPLRGPAYDQETRTAVAPQYLHRGPLTQGEKNRIDDDHLNMAQTVRAADDDIASLLASLGTREQNTFVMLLSDNGYLYGEHRSETKWTPYEEAMKVPAVIRYPALIPENQPTTTDALAQNVDVAPTIADLAGFPWNADGLSLVPLLDGSATDIRTAALGNHCEGTLYPCYSPTAVPSSYQIITSQYSYIEYATNERELFDLVNDPSELVNHAYEPSWAATRSRLSAQLAQLTANPPTDTTIVTGPSGPQHDRAFGFTYFSQSRFAHYECRLDGPQGLGTWQPCDQQPFVVGALADGDYTFNVRGTDEDGVTDPTPATRSFSILETGPHVQITSGPPLDGHSGDVTFQFTGDPSIVQYRCRIARFGVETTWQPCTSPASYTGLADGQWSFQVKGQTSGGATTDPPAGWLFLVDNTGPTFVLTERPPNPTNQTTATFAFYPDEPTHGPFSCKLDSRPRVDCSSGTVTFTNLVQANHTLLINATDLLGDKGKTTVKWTVDLTPPPVSITSGPPPLWNQNYALFSLDSSGQKSNFNCTLDSTPSIVCPRNSSFYELADGAHTMTVTAFDSAGNVSAAAIWNWTQQTAPHHRALES